MKILYLLICADVDQGDFNDAKRGTCYCHSCNCLRAIQRAIVKEYYARCYDCRYKRWFGVNEQLAKDESNAHWRRTNHRTFSGIGKRPNSVDAQDILDRTGRKADETEFLLRDYDRRYPDIPPF
jgi:hypothetical protein